MKLLLSPRSPAIKKNAHGRYRRAFGMLEPMESRILFHISAVTVAPDGKSATYKDVDGDTVKITTTAGAFAPAQFTFDGAGTVGGFQLETLNLTTGGFTGANLTIAATRVPGGDGLVNIGYINATGVNLGAVAVKGDLGRIDAGADSAATPAIKSLSVRSMGRLGTDTQAAGASYISTITGSLGSLAVAGDLNGAFITITSASSNGNLGAATIGGSIIGGTGDEAGSIRTTGNMGTVNVGGDIVGGSGTGSGRVLSGGALAGLTVGGSMIGGSGNNSGLVDSFLAMGGVKIGGDLRGGSAVFAGSIDSETKGVASVTIGGSLIGGTTNPSTAFITAALDIGPLKIGGSIIGGSGDESARVIAGGALVSVTIGGSVIGGSGNSSAEIQSTGNMGPLKIAHDMTGGDGTQSASVFTPHNIASVAIGGSIVGGNGFGSGVLSCGTNLGATSIGRDIVGGTGSGPQSGEINVNGALASITLGGSLIGGSQNLNGAINISGNIGAVKIAGNIFGGSVSGSASSDSTGFITATNGRIASVAVGGSIIAGTNTGTGLLTNNASIVAHFDIGSLSVGGNIAGNNVSGNLSPVIIVAQGQQTQGATSDLAIGKISVGGRVEFADFLAGYDLALNGANGDAQIGPVTVGGDWIASNLVAGAVNMSVRVGNNFTFGDGNDFSFGPGNANIVASIISVKINGQVFGTPNSVNSSDSFGFVAQQIGKMTVDGAAITLTAGPSNDNISLVSTNDVHVHEV